MRMVFVRILSCFILNREKRKRFRLRLCHRLQEPEIHGNGNELINCPCGVKVVIFGDNNRVEFNERQRDFRGLFIIGTFENRVSYARVTVGARTSCEYATVWILEDESVVSIGHECMLSKDIQIWSSDAHAITDRSGHLLNGGAHAVMIGDHCWIGFRSTLLKGTTLENDVVVGMNSTVTGGKILKANCVYAGSPARLVREGICWDRASPQNFINEREV